jgi:hypothetical protein
VIPRDEHPATHVAGCSSCSHDIVPSIAPNASKVAICASANPLIAASILFIAHHQFASTGSTFTSATSHHSSSSTLCQAACHKGRISSAAHRAARDAQE